LTPIQEQKIREYIDDLRYKSVCLARDLNNMTERDHIIRDALDKVIWDMEEILK